MCARHKHSLRMMAWLVGPNGRGRIVKPAVILALWAVVVLSGCASPSALPTQQPWETWERLCGETDHEEKVRKWEEDLDYMTEQLGLRHKNLYHNIPKEEFATAAQRLKDELPRLDDPGRLVEPSFEDFVSNTDSVLNRIISDY